MKNLLNEMPQNHETDDILNDWLIKARNLYKKPLDFYFEKINENGKWVLKFLHGYRIERESTYLNLLIYLCVVIGFWSYLFCNTIILSFFNFQCPQIKCIVVIIGTIILLLIALFCIKRKIRKQVNFKNLKKERRIKTQT